MWSGVAVVAAPSVERELALDHGAYTLVVFAAPMVLSAIAEARLALLSDRVSRPRLVAGGLVALAGSLVVCALGSSPWLLALGLALAGTASGVACGAAQAELVVRFGPERAMTRWAVAGALGDAVTPAAVAAVLALGLGHRAAFLAVAALVALQAGAAWASASRAPDAASVADGELGNEVGDEVGDEEGEAPLRDALRAAVVNRRLWLWLLGAGVCTLLDEIVVALAALHLRLDRGASDAVAASAATALAVGGAVGGVVVDRLVGRVRSTHVLAASAIACAFALVVAVLPGAVAVHLAALTAVGLAAAPHHPLLRARAYAEVPLRPGLVNGLDQAFVLLEVAAPLVVGAVAERAGLRAALLALLVQPLVVLALVALVRPPSALRS